MQCENSLRVSAATSQGSCWLVLSRIVMAYCTRHSLLVLYGIAELMRRRVYMNHLLSSTFTWMFKMGIQPLGSGEGVSTVCLIFIEFPISCIILPVLISAGIWLSFSTSLWTISSLPSASPQPGFRVVQWHARFEIIKFKNGLYKINYPTIWPLTDTFLV